MSEKIFFVDDDENILNAFKRDFRKRFDLLTATSGQEALAHSFSNDPIAVIVSDMRMPGMDGLELLLRIRDISPDTVRIMLTGNSDQETALNAINQGRIFRFYCKPCPSKTLADGIEEALAEHKNILAERELLESAYAGEGGGGLTGVVVGSILNLVKDVAKENNGVLTIPALEAVDREFRKNTGVLGRVIQRSFEEFIITRDNQVGEYARSRPFTRTLVSKFDSLFVDDDELGEAEDSFSRRILPGFFLAKSMMMGADTVKEKQELCRQIYDRMVDKEDEKELDWDTYYAIPEVQELAIDALVRFCFHFNNWEKRSDWFINMINSHLPPPKDNTPQDGAPWEFTRPAFIKLMNSLLSDLRTELESESGRAKIIKRFGPAACDDLSAIFVKIDQAS